MGSEESAAEEEAAQEAATPAAEGPTDKAEAPAAEEEKAAPKKSRKTKKEEKLKRAREESYLAAQLASQCLQETLRRANQLEATVAAAVARVDSHQGPPLLEFGSDCAAVLAAAEATVDARAAKMAAKLQAKAASSSSSSSPPEVSAAVRSAALASLQRQLVTAMEPSLRRHLQSLLRFSLHGFEDEFAALMPSVSDDFEARAARMRREAIATFRAGARAAIPAGLLLRDGGGDDGTAAAAARRGGLRGWRGGGVGGMAWVLRRAALGRRRRRPSRGSSAGERAR